MNKLIFSWSAYSCCSHYSFFASWENDIVEYEIDDSNHHFAFPNKKNGKLNKEESQKFIDYIKNAKIGEIEYKIKEQQEKDKEVLYFYCTDMPYYDVAYMNGNHIEMASWYSGEYGTIIEEQNYIYLAMMLCDESAIDFILGNIGERNDLKKFTGRIKSFIYSDHDIEIRKVDGSVNQSKYTNLNDLIDRLNIIFKNQNQLDIDEIEDIDWQVILINENDEIFSYVGDYEHYENMKALGEWTKENVKKNSDENDIKLF